MAAPVLRSARRGCDPASATSAGHIEERRPLMCVLGCGRSIASPPGGTLAQTTRRRAASAIARHTQDSIVARPAVEPRRLSRSRGGSTAEGREPVKVVATITTHGLRTETSVGFELAPGSFATPIRTYAGYPARRSRNSHRALGEEGRLGRIAPPTDRKGADPPRRRPAATRPTTPRRAITERIPNGRIHNALGRRTTDRATRSPPIGGGQRGEPTEPLHRGPHQPAAASSVRRPSRSRVTASGPHRTIEDHVRISPADGLFSAPDPSAPRSSV